MPRWDNCKSMPGFVRIIKRCLFWEAVVQEQGLVIRWYLMEKEKKVSLPLGKACTRA